MVTLFVVIGAVIYEITLARISRFSFEFSSSADVNLLVFVALAAIYGLGQYIILRWTQQKIISRTMKSIPTYHRIEGRRRNAGGVDHNTNPDDSPDPRH